MITSGPFKRRETLIKDVESFLIKHGTLFSQQGSRISHYFEMNCYNYVVKYYEKNGFNVIPQNTIGGTFRYKISAHGNPENFSYFLVSKVVRNKIYEFEVHHNLSLECAHESDIFYTADVSVINKGAVKRSTPSTYQMGRSHCSSGELQTFFEVKHLSPFPELLFSFTGIPENFLKREDRINLPRHLAPSLLISGRPNFHSEQIKKYLEQRYSINILLNLFAWYSTIYSNKYSKKTIGTL